ncbi:MAG: hypothetical protein ACREJC_20795 [Tepidisphaeraceae bacterium]
MRRILICLAMLLICGSIFGAQPATAPSEKTQSGINITGMDGTIMLPDGRTVNLADLKGNGMMMTGSFKMVGPDGTTTEVTDEQDRKIRIVENGEGIVVTINEDGKDPVEYRAENEDELEKSHPEAFALYERYGKDELHDPANLGQMGAMHTMQFQLLTDGMPRPLGDLGAVVSVNGDPFVRAQLGGGLVVMGVKKESRVGQLGLEQFDLIKTINGQPIESLDEIDTLGLSAEKLTIEVVRAGKPLKLAEK